jgi:hypothetical protein
MMRFMPDDLDEPQARALVRQFLDTIDIRGDDAWVITAVEEHDWGWVISWVNRRAAEGTRNPADQYAGGGPYLVDRHSGRVAMCGSAYPVAHYVELWRRGQWPDDPPPARLEALPGPWFDLRPGPQDHLQTARLAMVSELERELVPGHELHGETVQALAKCGHCGSVIFSLPDGRFALVHLTWTHGPERLPHPTTAIFCAWTSAMAAMAQHST